jgi:AcrR family transcriptional regulator
MTKHAQAALLGDLALDAAAGLFRRQGFAATTLRQVADEAGLHLGSLHYRWPTREALLAALVERAIERAQAAVTRAMAAAPPGPGALAERLRLGLRAHLALLLSGDASFHVMLYDWRALEGVARKTLLAQRARYEAFWDGLLREAIDEGLARPGVNEVLVRQFGFGAMNWVAQWYVPGESPDPAQIADAFWDYLAFGLLHPARKADVRPVASAPKRRAARAAPAPIPLPRRLPRKKGRS